LKILVADPIATKGVDFLKQHADVITKFKLQLDELKTIIKDCDAVIVRSQTKIPLEVIDCGKNLKVIGRAGVGIDNIDVDAATKKGITVVNAPTANTVSAAEHTMGLMLALARNIPLANSQLKSGLWQREKLTGVELRGKTLGILGVGNVGSEVAKRAQSFEMNIIAYDPFVSPSYASNIHVSLVPFNQLLAQSDFITLHLPVTPSTDNLIGPKELAKLKPSARIINCARGKLVDEKAVLKAIQEGKLAGAAFDVFRSEPLADSPLFQEDKIVVTPHLGASTVEAQAGAAIDVAEQVIAVLQGKPSKYTINAPHISPELMPFIRAALATGNLASQLMEGQVHSVHIKYSGEMTKYDCGPIKTAAISGFLQGGIEERINMVNANLIASQRGLKISEEKEETYSNYANLLTLQVTTDSGATTISSTIRDNTTHIVQINNFWIDIIPTGGYFLLCYHHDHPGLIGAIGNITGKANVNISAMHLSRLQLRGSALAILALDEALTEEQNQEVAALPEVYSAKTVKL